ncbi:nitroreductase family protein [Bradyrhizobium sp. SRL28]|uniref:nitroreductase family protein n=1 Tax=Bradyrhizobium sp. SRL28 TaxID=2836178 RepID=UPI0035B049FF
MNVREPAIQIRAPAHLADQIFIDRWSPRRFTEHQIPEGVLNTFFEAAQWAPSAF